MEMLDRYIHEVGRNLPRKGREDILTELRSTLEDTLEDRFGKEATEENVAALLKEYGPPKKVAASYQPAKYLIGPGLYPFFILVIQIGLGALAIAFLILFVLAQWNQPGTISSLGAALGQILASYVNAVMGFVAWVTVVFAILDRLELRPSVDVPVWNPRDLPPIQDPDRVSRVEMAVGIAFDSLLLILLNTFRDRIGFVVNPMSEMQFIRVPVLLDYLPWLSLLLVLDIALSLIVMRQERWQVGTRLAKIGMNLFGVAIFVRLFGDLSGWAALQDWQEPLPGLLAQSFRWIALVIGVVIAADTVKLTIRTVRSLGIAVSARIPTAKA